MTPTVASAEQQGGPVLGEQQLKSSADLISPLARLFLRQEYEKVDPQVRFSQLLSVSARTLIHPGKGMWHPPRAGHHPTQLLRA